MYFRYIERYIIATDAVYIKKISGVKMTITMLNVFKYLEYNGILYGIIKSTNIQGILILVKYPCGLTMTITDKQIRINKNNLFIDKFIWTTYQTAHLTPYINKQLNIIRRSFIGFSF